MHAADVKNRGNFAVWKIKREIFQNVTADLRSGPFYLKSYNLLENLKANKQTFLRKSVRGLLLYFFLECLMIET